MAEPKVSSELSRELTLFQITMMGLGMMIGAGVFLGIGLSIHTAGPGGVLLTFLLNGIIALFTAFAYAELSSALPYTGGAYNYARIGLGKGIGFITGWMEWFAATVAGSLYAVTFALYVVDYFKFLGLLNWFPFPLIIVQKILAFGIAIFFLYINYRGASKTGKVGVFFTLGQTLFLIVIGLVGIFVVIRDPSRLNNFQPFMPHGWSKLLITMGFTYVAFEGYEVIAQTGDEAIDPRRNIPKAMLISVFVVTITYLIVSFATLVSIKAGDPGISGAPWEWIAGFRELGFGEAVSHLVPKGKFLVTLAVIFAATSALNATTYSATRALYALGRDNMLPKTIAKISPKTKTPWVALLLTGVLLISTAVFLPTLDVASSASMMFLILFFMVNICVIKVRSNLGDELTYGFLMPFFPVLPIIAIIAQGVLAVWLIHMSLIAWIIVPVWICAGIVIYHLYSKSHAVTGKHEIRVIEEEISPEAEGYHIMVSVANPKSAIEMVKPAYRLCKAKDAHVELLHMVPVPDQVPLSAAKRYMWTGKEAIVEAALYLEQLFPVSSTLRYCRNIARGIVSAVRQKRVNMLILGWHGKKKPSLFSIGSTIDPIIERSPCNVVVLKGKMEQSYKRILVPLAGGPNGSFALEIADIMADDQNSLITVFTVGRKMNKFDIQTYVASEIEKQGLNADRITVKTVYSNSVLNAILKEALEHELIIMGSTRKPFIYQVGHDSIPEIVARRCTKPLIMVNAAGGITSWLKRWI